MDQNWKVILCGGGVNGAAIAETLVSCAMEMETPAGPRRAGVRCVDEVRVEVRS